jgi:hypothetical protein
VSAFGTIKDYVESLLTALHTRDDEQDIALKALEDRVTALENQAAPAARKVTQARAGAASADAKATPSK